MSNGRVPPPQPGSHVLRPRSFSSPTKCLRCTSLMLGLSRQGLGCDGETAPHTPPLTRLPGTSHSPEVSRTKATPADAGSGATMASGKLGLGMPRVLVLGCPHAASHHLLLSPQPVATTVTQLVPHRPHPALCPPNSSAQPWECTLKQAQALPTKASCR